MEQKMVGEGQIPSENVSRTKFHLWYHESYTSGIDEKARFPRDRYDKILAQLQTLPNSTKLEIKTPEPISRELLLLGHSTNYVDNFLNGALSESEMRRIGLTPWKPEIVDRTLLLTGGALEATLHAVQNGGLAGNMAGGTHHAHRDFGSGYCIFNDLAICAKYAVSELKKQSVVVLDLDVHQGDGTATILQSEQNILTISLHCSTNFPFRKSVSDIDIPLPPGISDDIYLQNVKIAIQNCLDFNPDLVLFQSGVDGLATDALGKLNISREGMQKRNQMVFDAMLSHRIPTVIFMGGGYSKPIEYTVDAFVDLFGDAITWNEKWHFE